MIKDSNDFEKLEKNDIDAVKKLQLKIRKLESKKDTNLKDEIEMLHKEE
jgi:hypothetical protein